MIKIIIQPLLHFENDGTRKRASQHFLCDIWDVTSPVAIEDNQQTSQIMILRFDPQYQLLSV